MARRRNRHRTTTNATTGTGTGTGTTSESRDDPGDVVIDDPSFEGMEVWKRRVAFAMVAERKVPDYKAARAALDEFHRFMFLKEDARDYDAEKLSPSRVVDVVWHTAILDTEYYPYERFRHDPLDHLVNPAERDKRYLATLEAYKRVFKGDPPAAQWEAPRGVPTRKEEVPSAAKKEVSSAPPPSSEPEKKEIPSAPPPSSEPEMTILLATTFGKQAHIRTKRNATVKEFMECVQEQLGIPPDAMRLIWKSAELDRLDNTLVSYGVKDQDKIHLLLRLRGC